MSVVFLLKDGCDHDWQYCYVGQPRKTFDIIIVMGARWVGITYSVEGGPVLTAIIWNYVNKWQPQYIVVGAQNGKTQKCSSPSNLCEFKAKHHYPILESGPIQMFQEYRR